MGSTAKDFLSSMLLKPTRQEGPPLHYMAHLFFCSKVRIYIYMYIYVAGWWLGCAIHGTELLRTRPLCARAGRPLPQAWQ